MYHRLARWFYLLREWASGRRLLKLSYWAEKQRESCIIYHNREMVKEREKRGEKVYALRRVK